MKLPLKPSGAPNLFGTMDWCSYENLMLDDLGGAEIVMLVLGSGCKYRWQLCSLACRSPPAVSPGS